ncbi:hypothetical protein MJH12_01950 [bacterium]|nr:hypothetical protein [bacterium]
MWEYCEVRYVKGTLGGVYIKYFLVNSAPIELQKDPNFILGKHESGLERAVAQLGALDWELVNKPSSEPYLFKRNTSLSQYKSYPVIKGFVKVDAE